MVPLDVARVDAHVHVWDLAVRPQPWTAPFPVLQRSFDLGDLAAVRRPAGVAGVVLVQADASFAETIDLLALAAAHPEVAGVVGWVDLTADVTTQLGTLRDAPGGSYLVGLRHQLQIETDPAWIARDDVRQGLLVAAGAGLCFDVVVAPEQLSSVAAVVRGLPQLRFVLDHAGKPPLSTGAATDPSPADRAPADETPADGAPAGGLARWRSDLEQLAAVPNVAVKLSGLVTEADWQGWTPADLLPVIDYVITTFGPARVMFGSDWPVCALAATYAQVVTLIEQAVAGLDRSDQQAVWHDSARAWYRLVPR